MSNTAEQIKKETKLTEIADVQNFADTRQIPINKVGIKDIKHPVVIKNRCGGIQNTIANFNMTVNLPHNFKGTHMSRFVEILNSESKPVTAKSFQEILKSMTSKLEAQAGHIKMEFPFFINKKAPISGVESLLDYQAAFIADFIDNKINLWLQVVVPVTSLCPCSKKISDYGAHNQRSHVTVKALITNFVWLEDLIDIIEKNASCELYGLLKRPDEKYVTEKAYDNPKFVEDIVRDIAYILNTDNRISAYKVESENFESIHNHSAYAMIEHDKKNVIN